MENLDLILASIPAKKPYFHPQYVNIMAGAERGGLPEFFMITEGGRFAYYQYVRRDIAFELPEEEKGVYFDIITPFDYGGYFCSDEGILKVFLEEFKQYCRDTNIISEFIRFLPTHNFNYQIIAENIELVKVSDHVFIHLSSSLNDELSSIRKRLIRKSIKYDVKTSKNNDLKCFVDIYRKTMNRCDAHSYFYFSNSILRKLVDFCGDMYVSTKGDKVISSILLLKGESEVYYFLGGNNEKYFKYGGSTKLFYDVARIYKDDKDIFFLGGGNAGVIEFKQGFSRKTFPYFIGKKVHNEEIYDQFVMKNDRRDNSFFPKYREKVI